MSFAINVEELRERASKRVATLETVATLLPDQGSKVARVATDVRSGGNPLLTIEQGDACHAGGWDDAEIMAFTARRDRLLRWGYDEQAADDMAERLTLRDRERDDRHVCSECRHGRSSRCPDGAPLPGDVLHRCGEFAGRAHGAANLRGDPGLAAFEMSQQHASTWRALANERNESVPQPLRRAGAL